MLWRTYDLDDGVEAALRKAIDDMISLLKSGYTFHSIVMGNVRAFPPDNSGVRSRLQLNYESH